MARSASPPPPAVDEDEPALAAAGPPAITRRMFELWRREPAVRGGFDIATPLGRRDYLHWFAGEAAGWGIDGASRAAASAILRRGISLSRETSPWSPQSRLTAPRRENIDSWLAAPINLPFAGDAVIPLPRCLALLWELRQDARMHFRNETARDVAAFIAWCLTQGIGDGCVAIDLTEPSLADFLDGEDEAYPAADGPPVTRLLRLMAPLYGGPFAEQARDFPVTRASRLAVAMWVCGAMRRRHDWPATFLRRLQRWFAAPAPALSDAFLSIDNLLYALWELAPELQQRCDIRRHEGRSALLDWFVGGGSHEYELDDLLITETPAAAVHQRHPAAKPLRRGICLTGYARLVSGRAEDLRMTATALRRRGQACAILDRVSGAIAADGAEEPPSPARPPAVNIVHLNADTAFFDHLFLRQRGFAGTYTIGYWAWELARFPEEWMCAFSFVDEVWAASRFSYEAIRAVATKPVFLMPLAVDEPRPDPVLGRRDFGLLPEDSFVVYVSFDFRSFIARKNPLSAIAAFRRAFPRGSDRAVLVLKTIGSSWRTDDRRTLIDAIGGDPRIRLLDIELGRAEAAALMALCDCFLSLHRSEGFGRGPAEAMMLGKPVIATAYSGTADFTAADSALLIDYELVPVGPDDYPGATGQVWAEPDIDQAAAAMRRLASDPALARQLGNAGRSRIRALCDPTTVGARYLDRITAILQSR